MQFTSNTQIYLSSIRQILAKSEYQKKLYLSYYVAPPFSRNIWAYWEKIYFHKSIWPSYPCSACQMLICKNNKYTSCKYCSQNKSALPYCDSKTHLSLGKRNPVHRRLFERPYIRQFFWLCFIAGLVFPVSQWHYKTDSTLQLRDSTGFAPVYLLSINTPDTLLFSFSLVRFLNFIAIYHAVFAVPQRGKYLHAKLSKLLIMYIGFFLILH